MADYVSDIRRYTPDVDGTAAKAIVAHLGIALKSADASLVACSSKSELVRIRESWLKGKLGLAQRDADLDKSLKEVCERMKSDTAKQRVTFYYLLAEAHGKLAVLSA